MGEVSRTPIESQYQVEGSSMRIIVALAAIATSLALGGCFHHTQQIYTAELPPAPVTTPIK